MEFTRREFDLFRKDLDEALRPLGEKYGLNFEQGKITYGDISFTINLTATKKEIDGRVIDRAEEEFKQYCTLYSFKPEDWRAECHVGSDRRTVYLIAGLKLNARKNSVVIERKSDGKRFKCSREAVVLAREEK